MKRPAPAAGAPDGGAGKDLCLRCGRCCHEKFRVGRAVVITDIPCPHLDTATRLCRVYGQRFQTQPKCATAAAAAQAGAMPGDCPYALRLPGYTAPVMLADHPEYAAEADAYFPGQSALANAWLAEGKKS